MAKPSLVASAYGASSSTCTPPHPSRHRQDHKPRRRRRKAASAATTAVRSLAPSPILLSLLSLVAASTVAEGSPAPPAFLCPSIQPTTPPRPIRRRRKASVTASADAAVKSTVPHAVVRNIADKYERGEDGIWRRVESYTLYGVCPTCSKGPVSAIDEQISRPDEENNTASNTTYPPVASTAAPTTTMDAAYDYIPDTLPPGWAPKKEHYGHEGRTTLILAMSLVLAFLICILIIACLFWRKSLRRKYRERDLEGKGKGKGRRRNQDVSPEEARQALMEKESKVKQKLWARATARWKENVRYTARQRRGKRTTSSIRSRTARSSISLDNPGDGLTSGRSSPTSSTSLPPSRFNSRRNSTASVQHDPSLDSSPSPHEHAIPTISISPPSHPHSSPPAYRQQALNTNDCSEGLYANNDPVSTAHLVSGEPLQSSCCSQTDSAGELSPNRAAHVATDDKAVLARLADLASQPPSNEATAGPASDQQVSAPEWQDEELEDLIAATQEGGSDDLPESSVAPPSPFPPPPSKANLHSPNFYDYPYAFEEMEIVGVEPELGPSAPPFEEVPSSGCVIGEHGIPPLIPSAPPMPDDGESYVEMSPSAPALTNDVEGYDGDGSPDGAQQSTATSAGSGSTGNVRPSMGDNSNDGLSLPKYCP